MIIINNLIRKDEITEEAISPFSLEIINCFKIVLYIFQVGLPFVSKQATLKVSY